MIDEAIILAGGLGTRLREAVPDRPKPMATVLARPFVAWLLLALRGQGIRRAVLATGFGAEQLEAWFEAHPLETLDVSFSREDRPLGTGGAARLALEQTRGEAVAVLNGDSYCPPELAGLERARRKAGAGAAMQIVEVDDGGRYGSVECDEKGCVKAFREKSGDPGRGWINAGVYVLARKALAQFPLDQPLSLEREVFPALLPKGVAALPSPGPFLDIGTPEAYRRAEDFLRAEFEGLAAQDGQARP